jgi:hypothetical protein
VLKLERHLKHKTSELHIYIFSTHFVNVNYSILKKIILTTHLTIRPSLRRRNEIQTYIKVSKSIIRLTHEIDS